MSEHPVEAAKPHPLDEFKILPVVVLALIPVIFIISIFKFSGIGADFFASFNQSTGPRQPVDFDVFYLAAQMVWRGEIEQAYSFVTMGPAQKALSGKEVFMPWTYPPQFSLLVAPLAFVPLGMAYGLFIGTTLLAYLLTLRAIAGNNKDFLFVLTLLLPAISITISCGQNGFLTGTLIGLACLGFLKSRALAGLPLGLMIIKPHLAVTFAVYTLVSRRWGTAAIAFAVVVATSGIVTILLGPGIWNAFLGGIEESKVFLEKGFYPLFRMVSVYAVFHIFDFPATIAMAMQVLVAILSLIVVVLAYLRGLTLRQSLGLTAIASLLISPYAYDYDLPIFGIGIALLLPDLIRLGSRLELALLYGFTFVAGLFGGVLASIIPASQDEKPMTLTEALEDAPLTLAGLMLVAVLVIAWRIVIRDRNSYASVNTPAAIGADAPAMSPSRA